MQKDQKSLEIGDVAVYPGSQVNVHWQGVWYEGAVIKLGPHSANLCRVRDIATKRTLLMSTDLQNMRPKGKQSSTAFKPTRGARVMYREGENWREGEIVGTQAVGDAFVRWRKSALGGENENWFALKDIAPIIHNEAYLAYHRDQLEAGRHGLIPNDMINPKPRTVLNPLLQQSPDAQPAPNHKGPETKREKLRGKVPASPTYESIASEDILSNVDKIPPPPPPLIPAHYTGFPDNTASMFSTLPPQSGYRRSMEQSSLPCMWSYKDQTGGIPPHHSSQFFKLFQTSHADRRYLLHRSALHHYRHSNLKQAHSFTTFKPRHPTGLSMSVYSEPGMNSNSPSAFKGKRTSPGGGSAGGPAQNRLRHSPNRRDSPRLQRQRHRYNRRRLLLDPRTRHRKGSPPNQPQPYEIPQRSQIDPRSRHNRPLPPPPRPLPNPPTASQAAASNEPVEYTEVQFTKPKGAPPTVTSSSPPVVMMTKGHSTLLTCAARSMGTAPLKYEWCKDGNKLASDGKSVPSDRIPTTATPMPPSSSPLPAVKGHKVTFPAPEMLHIENISAEDVGKYSCVVSNEYGSETRNFYLGLTAVSAGETKTAKKFTNKVTSEELGIPLPEPEPDATLSASPMKEDEENRDLDLDSLLDLDPELFSMEGRTDKDGGGPETDARPEVPKIVVTEERKTLKANRHRVSSVLENGVEQYLSGGLDYGAVSSKTDLDKEGLERFKPIEVARSLDRLDAIRTKAGEKEEKQESGGEEVQPPEAKPETDTATGAANGKPSESTFVKSASKAAKKLLKIHKRPGTPRLGKKVPTVFQTSNILHEGEGGVLMTARIKGVPEPGQFKLKTFPS